MAAAPGRQPTKVAELIAEAAAAGNETLAGALRRFRRLTRDQQRQLVHEIVLTRSDELRLAYTSITAIAAGYRRRVAKRPAKNATVTSLGEQITREPAVVFQVARKWTSTPKTAATRRKTLPRWLLTFTNDPRSGARVLCAVPTDVTQVRGTGRPQAAPDREKQIVATSRADRPIAGTGSDGVVSCVVSVQEAGGPKTLFAVGCHHVFARSVAGGRAGRVARAPIEVEWPASPPPPPPRTVVATTSPVWLGRLRRASAGLSLDAAFATLGTDAAAKAAIGRALGALRAVDTLTPTELVPSKAVVLTPQNGRVSLSAPELVRDCAEIDYFGEPRDHPRHDLLIRWQISGRATSPGDSGSPVVTPRRENSQLLGLHLGSRATGGVVYEYTLPIYFVLNPVNFGQPGSTRIRYRRSP